MGPWGPHLYRRSHPHRSYRSLQGKPAALVVPAARDTRLKMFSKSSMGGRMDFTTKSGYNLPFFNTTVMLRLYLGKGVFLG